MTVISDKFRETFNAYANANGNLTPDVFMNALQSVNSSLIGKMSTDSFAIAASALDVCKADIPSAFESYNYNRDGFVEISDIVSRAMRYDDNQDGALNIEELARFTEGAPVSDIKTVSVEPQTGDRSILTDSRVFNVQTYQKYHPDLQHMTAEQATEHWLTHGIKERRIASENFDVDWVMNEYSGQYPDLVRTPTDAITNWITSGATLPACARRPNALQVSASSISAAPPIPLSPLCAPGEILDEHGMAISNSFYQDGTRVPGSRPALNGQGEQIYNNGKPVFIRNENYTEFGIVKPINFIHDLHVPPSNLNIDVYEPAKNDPDTIKNTNPEGKIPVVINLTGGGFATCHYQGDFQVAAGKALTDQGFVVLSPQYHVTLIAAAGSEQSQPKGQYPQPVLDLQAILRFVVQEAPKHNWDLNKITLMGHSAGGTLSLTSVMDPAFQHEGYDLTKPLLPEGALPPIKNVVAVAPATNFAIDYTDNSDSAFKYTSPDLRRQDDAATQWINAAFGNPTDQSYSQTANNNRWTSSPLAHVQNFISLPEYDNNGHRKPNILLSYARNDGTCLAEQQFDPFINAFSGDSHLNIDEHATGGHSLMGYNPTMQSFDFSQGYGYYSNIGNWIKSQ